MRERGQIQPGAQGQVEVCSRACGDDGGSVLLLELELKTWCMLDKPAPEEPHLQPLCNSQFISSIKLLQKAGQSGKVEGRE